jgi:hypothetical protein
MIVDPRKNCALDETCYKPFQSANCTNITTQYQTEKVGSLTFETIEI